MTRNARWDGIERSEEPGMSAGRSRSCRQARARQPRPMPRPGRFLRILNACVCVGASHAKHGHGFQEGEKPGGEKRRTRQRAAQEQSVRTPRPVVQGQEIDGDTELGSVLRQQRNHWAADVKKGLETTDGWYGVLRRCDVNGSRH